MFEKFKEEKNAYILGIVNSVFLMISSLVFTYYIFGDILINFLKYPKFYYIISFATYIVEYIILLAAYILLAIALLHKYEFKVDITKVFAVLYLIANIIKFIYFITTDISLISLNMCYALNCLYCECQVLIAFIFIVFYKKNKPENSAAKIIMVILFAISVIILLICYMLIIIRINYLINYLIINISLFLFFVLYPKEYIFKKPYKSNGGNIVDNSFDAEYALRIIKEKYESGQISQEEYTKLKSEIINQC